MCRRHAPSTGDRLRLQAGFHLERRPRTADLQAQGPISPHFAFTKASVTREMTKPALAETARIG
jgi:hypothetical protein